MNLHWIEIAKGAWHVMWISTLYSYAACGVSAVVEGYRTRGDKAKIDAAVERFIISPFYVATLFTLISILFYTVGKGLVHQSPGTTLISVAAMAAMLFVAQLVLEIIESTFIQHDVFRLLKDQDAMRLFGIAACVYVFLVVMVGATA